jgi:hypothetical protein
VSPVTKAAQKKSEYKVHNKTQTRHNTRVKEMSMRDVNCITD